MNLSCEMEMEQSVREQVEEELFDPDNSCCICFNNFAINNNVNKCTTICGHSFHTGCLLKNGMYRDECPMCRHCLIENNEHESENTSIMDEDDVSTIGNDELNNAFSYVDNTGEISRVSSRRRSIDDEDPNAEDNSASDDESSIYEIFWKDADKMISGLLRLDIDVHNQHTPSLTRNNYYENKHKLRSNVVSSLSHLTDEEWKLAEYDILKTISKYYGKKINEIWEEDEVIGLGSVAC